MASQLRALELSIYIYIYGYMYVMDHFEPGPFVPNVTLRKRNWQIAEPKVKVDPIFRGLLVLFGSEVMFVSKQGNPTYEACDWILG